MKIHYKKTGKKIQNANVVIPDMEYYRKATENDRKQKGDLFNAGKYYRREDEWVLASCPNGNWLHPWESYYLVLKERVKHE